MTADGRPPGQYARHRKVQGLGRAIISVSRNWPLQAALFDGPKIADRALEAAAAWNPQVAIVVTERLPYTTIALSRRFPVILDVVDSMALHMSQRASRASPLIRWLWKLEAHRFERLAARLADEVSAVVAASTTARD